MSRLKLLFIFCIGCFVVLAGGFSLAAYFWKEAVVPPPPMPAVTASAEQSGLVGRSTLTELHTTYASTSVECALSFADDSFVSEGTAFISGDHLRVDALSRLGTSSVVSLVATPGNVVAWQSDMIPHLPLQLSSSTDTIAGSSSPLALWTLVVSYSCHEWIVDRSVFAVQ